METIRRVHEETGYTLDPHTAVGMHAALKIAEGEEGAVVTLATAHPAKFPDAVEKATGVRPDLPPHLSDLLERQERLTELPNDLQTVQNFVREHSKSNQQSAA